jgi:Spy/CpxP family protein refolding chaperone
MPGFLYLILCGVLIAGLSAPAFADSDHPGPKGPRIEQRIEELKSHLNLSDDQIQQIKDILTKSAPDKAPPKERFSEFKAAEAKIAAVLTPEQKIKYDQFKAEIRTKNKTEMHAKTMEHLKAELKLTDEQTEKVSKILATFQDEMIAISKSDPKMSEGRDQMKIARTKRETELKNVLTAAQMDQLKAMKEHHKPGHPPEHRPDEFPPK